MEYAEMLFDEFIEDDAAAKTADGKALAAVSRRLDAALENGGVTHELLAEYELAALRAGFMAGYAVALGV